ncbi:MAG: tetratricopeptide repeat protein [Halieaceae bacterium]|nr:tetratricopeptide repeat protein [Halieaceae bacterium]
MRTGVLLIVLLLAAPLSAKETVVGMNKRTYDTLNEVQIFMEAEQWDEAIASLQQMGKRKLSGYETAHMLNMYGFIYYSMGDNDRALENFGKALEQEGLPNSQVRGLLNSATQVSLSIGDFPAAEAYAKRLLEAETEAPQPLSQVLLAQAYVGQERWADAEGPLKKALAMLEASGATPRENWMVMLSSIYHAQEKYVEMRDLLYKVVKLYPRERYILNLAALNGQLGEPEKQLALIESLEDDERLNKGFHFVTLANLFLSQGVPHKAAQLLEREIASGRVPETRQNLELTSQAWYLAGDEARAIPPLLVAAEMENDGKLYLRVARLHMDLYQWRDAEKVARQALATENLEEPGDAWLLVGMALARGDKLEAARTAFVQAAEYDSSEKWARQWMRFVETEQARIASLTEGDV